jgi:hypothetical protein
MRHGKRGKGKQRRQRKERQTRAPTPSAASAAPSRASGPTEASQGSAGRVTVPPWWKSELGRVEYELTQLNAADIDYEIDEREKADGILVIHLKVPTEAGDHRLVVRFPDVYPYTRFEVIAPEMRLERHQNPVSGQLCLIGRATRNWSPSNTLASLLKEQLPKLLHTARNATFSEVETIEEHQGEPLSDYYTYHKDNMLMVDATWPLGFDARSGVMTVGLEDRPDQQGLRGAVLALKDEQGQVLIEAEPVFSRLYRKHLEFRWVKLDEPIREANPERFFEALYAHNPRLSQPKWKQYKGKNHDLVGVIFPEEQRWREQGNGWVFAVRSTQYGQSKGGMTTELSLARAGRASRADLTERVPELRSLSSRSVALIGLGALGAPSAFELARCGIGELRVLDHDYVDPATTMRWPLGLTAAGKSKVAAVADFIAANYPHTEVVSIENRLGACRPNATMPSDNKILEDLFAGIDLVYDASAELGLNHLLSDQAAARGVPYICVSTTHGAWGGRLIRTRPGGQTAGCWMCHQWGINEGEIPTPPADPRGDIQPAGCSDPTFTGAGFDVASVALAGVRLAVSTLVAGEAEAYPEIGWDVAILHMRDENGRLLIAPRWDTYPLGRHPECKNDRAHIR